MAGIHNVLLGVGGVIVDTQTITAEYLDESQDPKAPIEVVGYASALAGSISDGTSSIYGEATINAFSTYGGPGDPGLTFEVLGTFSNSGWSKIIITHTYSGAITTWNRLDASFSTASGSTKWTWSGPTGPFLNVTPGQNTYVCRFYN